MRGLEYYEYYKPSNRVQFDKYKDIYSDERDKPYVYGHKPNVRVKLERGYYDFTFISNSEGLREEKDYGVLPKSVVILGDSVVEGSSVENSQMMDSVFEAKTGITALNFGLASSGTAQQYYWLKGKYKREYNARLVILFFELNDFGSNDFLLYFHPTVGNWGLFRYLDDRRNTNLGDMDTVPKRGRAKSPPFGFSAWTSSRFLDLVRTTIREVSQRQQQPLPWASSEVTPEQEHFTEKYILKIREFCQHIGTDFFVVILPRRSQLTHDYPEQGRRQDVLIEILERHGIHYLDVYPLVKEKFLAHPTRRWFHDDAHFYVPGHQLLGEMLAAEVPKRFPHVME